MTAPASEEKLPPPSSYETWLDCVVDGWGVSSAAERIAKAELSALRAALAERTRERDGLKRQLDDAHAVERFCSYCGTATQFWNIACAKCNDRIDRDSTVMARAKSDAAACAECILGEESITDEVVAAARRVLSATTA